MAQEISDFNEQQILQALKDNRGITSMKRKQRLGRNNITALKEENGTLMYDLHWIVAGVKSSIYTNLYRTRQTGHTASLHTNTNTGQPPPILPSEVRAAIKRLKCNKTPGEKYVTAQVLQSGGGPIVKMFTKLFNNCLSSGKVPDRWKMHQ